MRINGKSDGGGRQPVITGISITENGRYTAPLGVDGYSPVNVDVDADPELQDKNITENGTYSADEGYDGLNQVVVDVQPELQEKVINEMVVIQPMRVMTDFHWLRWMFNLLYRIRILLKTELILPMRVMMD